ncbi:MAG: hypothetical protein J6Y69_05440 [Treponema sp.]|nr:hypothetical protein [Treponema sp.]
MKRISVLALFLTVLCASSVWAEGWTKGLEIGGGARFELAMGDMKEHESGNLGFTIDATMPLPLGLSGDGILSAVGLSAQTGVLFPIGKKSYIDSWWALDFDIGAYIDLKFSELVTLRPGASFDIRLNSVKSEEKNVSGMFADYGARLGATVLFDAFKNGILIKAGADYVLLPEQNNICHYLSFSLGATYRFE